MLRPPVVTDPEPEVEIPNRTAPPAARVAPRPSPLAGLISLAVIVRIALRALHRNFLRSALTCLGIVIGIAAVIAMMEIGQGSAVAIRERIATLGANVLQVEPGASSSSGIRMGAGTTLTLTPGD